VQIHIVDVAEEPTGASATARRLRRDGFVAGLSALGHGVTLTEVDLDLVAAGAPLADLGAFDVVHALSVAVLPVVPRSGALVVSPRVSVSRVGGQSVVHVERGAAQALARTPARIRTIEVPSVEAGSAWGPAISSLPIVTVPMGVDTERYTPRGTSAAAKEDRVRVLAFGLPGTSHGFHELVRILPHTPSVDVVFAGAPGVDLAGSQTARETYSLACALGVDDRVSFARTFDEDAAPHVLRSSDVVVAVTGNDINHYLVLQAMACGKPVVSANMGAFLDIVVDDVTGLLVPHGNESALRTALRRLTEDAFFREGLGLAGRDRAVSRFDWSRVTAEAVRVYERSRVAAMPMGPSSGGDSVRTEAEPVEVLRESARQLLG